MQVPRLAAAAVTVAAVATAAALPQAGRSQPAGAAAAPSGTLEFVLKESKRDTKLVDLAPKGESVGDRIVLSSTARKDGRVAGRTEAECILQDKTYEGFACVGDLMLADGTLTFQGASVNKAIPNVPRTSDELYAITGGTGAYQGAAGTVRLHGPEKAEVATITFFP